MTHTPTRRVEFIPMGRISDLMDKPGADLILLKPGEGVFSDYKVIRFSSRLALESFNKKAGLRPLVYTMVKKGCAIWKHQKEEYI